MNRLIRTAAVVATALLLAATAPAAAQAGAEPSDGPTLMIGSCEEQASADATVDACIEITPEVRGLGSLTHTAGTPTRNVTIHRMEICGTWGCFANDRAESGTRHVTSSTPPSPPACSPRIDVTMDYTVTWADGSTTDSRAEAFVLIPC